MKDKFCGGIVACIVIMICHSLSLAADKPDYTLKETHLDKALLRVGQDFRLTILFQTLEIKGLKTSAITVRKNIRQVLGRLLADHPFDYKFINSDTLVIFRIKDKKPIKIQQEEHATIPPQPNNSLPAERFVEEIVISSRRWIRNLQTSPASVSLFTQNYLSSPDVGRLDQLSVQASNVTLDYTSTLSGSSNSLVAYIRGIGQSDFAIATDPGIGIYLDGIYLSRSIGSVIDLAEYSSVEIYKGPHGNLFSRNAIGGTINITSHKPGKNFQIRGQFTTGSNARKDVLINMDIPLISDKLLGNFLFVSRNRDGYGTRLKFSGLTAADINSLESIQGNQPSSFKMGNQNVDHIHGKIVWDAGNDVEYSLITDVSKSRELTPVSTLVGFNDNVIGPDGTSIGKFYNQCITANEEPSVSQNLCSGLYGVNVDMNSTNDRTPFDARFVTNSPYENFSSGPNHSNHDIFSMIGTLQWQINENLFLKYITGFRHTEAELGRDGDKTPLLLDHTSYVYDHKQHSQEIQLSGAIDNIQWYGGFPYFYEKARMSTHVVIGGLPLIDLQALEKSKNISYNYFGHANIPLAQGLSITGGFHFAKEEKNLQLDFHEVNLFAVRQGLPLSQFPDPDDLTLLRPNQPDKIKLTTLSPRFSMEYDNNDFFAYFSAAKSTKPGGFNYRAVQPATTISSFDPENTWSFEAGIKINYPDSKVQFNFAAFYTNYQELQLVSLIGVTPEIENAGNAAIWGIEFDSRIVPMDNMNISTSFGYIHTKYTELSETSRIQPDNHFQKTPKWTFNFSADYTIPLSGDISLLWKGSYNFKSDIYHNATNTELLRQPPVHLANTSLTAEFLDKKWSIAFGVNNLLNEEYIISGFDQPGVGFTEATFARPRNWYLSLTFRR